jgi:hypothetical protein
LRMKITYFTLALFLAYFVCVQGSASWTGTWLDNRNYTVSLCETTDGKKLQGSYEQFGIIQGKISDDGKYAQGRWYEARNPLSESPCPTGGFSFRLIDADQWVGNYDCADQHGGDNFDWNGGRYAPDIIPSRLDCAVLNDELDVNVRGSWIVSPSILTFWDICAYKSEHKYISSYECDTQLNCKGYEQGFVYEDGKVMIGEFTNDYPDSNSVDGTAISALLYNGQIVHYQWASPISSSKVLSGTQHIAEFNITYAGDTVDSLCVRNQDVYDELYFHFSANSLPDEYTIVSNNNGNNGGVGLSTNDYVAPSRGFNNSFVQYEPNQSNSKNYCFLLVTLLLLLV